MTETSYKYHGKYYKSRKFYMTPVKFGKFWTKIVVSQSYDNDNLSTRHNSMSFSKAIYLAKFANIEHHHHFDPSLLLL